MKNKKMKYFLVWLFIFVIGFQASMLFQITVAVSADNYTPQNSDYAMSVSVDLSNLSVYEVSNGNTTSANITAKLSAVQPRLLMYYPDAQVFSGSSPQAVLYSYNNLQEPTQASLFKTKTTPVITSFSNYGYKHIDSISPVNFNNGILAKVMSTNSPASLDAIEAFSSVMANHYGIMSLKSMNANFSQSDFNQQIGQQTTQKLKYSDTAILSANVTAVDNMSSNTFAGTVDPNYASLASQYASWASSGPITTQDINPNANQVSKQQTFFAGYNNFSEEAIQTPVKDYAIQALASQGIYLTTDQLAVNYTSMNDITNNIQISSSLRDHVLSPYKNSSLSSLTGVHLDLSFLGLKIFSKLLTVQEVNAGWGLPSFKVPKLNFSGIENGMNDIGHAAGSFGNSIAGLPSLAIGGAKSFSEDTAGPAFNALFHTPQHIINSGQKAVSSFTGKIAKGAVSLTKGLTPTNIMKTAQKSLNPMSWMGSGFSTSIMSFVKPYLPYIAIGIVVIVIAALLYMFGPTIIGGILSKKL